MTLRIYLADLTHTGNGIATEAFPLNVGLLATSAQKTFGLDISIDLFKFPEHLAEAIEDSPPDVLGCSNYTWNANLSYYFTKLAKIRNPDVLTVWGGTNYPFDTVNQEAFLHARPAVDVHTFYEGEPAFANIIERRLSVDVLKNFFDSPIDGCQFVTKKEQEFVTGNSISRTRQLDDIPSPYVSGLFDRFFKQGMTPLVETARGCPFKCNFCNAGDSDFNKVNQFSDDYVKEELSYIAQRAADADIGHVTFADNNFGMIPRDERTVQVVHDLQIKTGWPRTMTVWTGKNSKERVINATRLLGSTLNISMSVQAMDSKVLKNVQRDNIKIDDYRAIANELDLQGRQQLSEVIMPLPGETLETHIKGLCELLDTKVSRVLSHTLQMLHGTPYKDNPKFIKDYGFETKWRIVPLDFTEISGNRLFDVEEVAIATKDFSFAEYLKARVFMLLIELCHNSHIFKLTERYLRSFDIMPSELLMAVFESVVRMPTEVDSVINSFREESINELWDSEEEMVVHYKENENYKNLVDGKAGGNVLFKHSVMMLSDSPISFVRAVHQDAKKLLMDRTNPEDKERINSELEDLCMYTESCVRDCHSPDSIETIVNGTFEHDVFSWAQCSADHSLSEFKVQNRIPISFGFSDRNQMILKDAFKRYGDDRDAIVKLIQRIGKSPTRDPFIAEQHLPEKISAFSERRGFFHRGH